MKLKGFFFDNAFIAISKLIIYFLIIRSYKGLLGVIIRSIKQILYHMFKFF